MKFKLVALVMTFGMMSLGFVANDATAAEILTKEDFVQKIVTQNELVKIVDNFIILFDSSSSTKKSFRETDTPKFQVAKSILEERNFFLPDLGYNAGLYLYTPFKEIYPVQPWDREKFADAINQLPDKAGGPTLLMQALIKIEPVLKNLSGRTAVFIISDGNWRYNKRFWKIATDNGRHTIGGYNK